MDLSEDEDEYLSSGDESKKRYHYGGVSSSSTKQGWSYRKKSRSLQSEPEHTGLSPRLNRMDIVTTSFPSTQTIHFPSTNIYFLEDGVETFCAGDDGGDPRIMAVREIYLTLDIRLERAAYELGVESNDPLVLNMKKQLPSRAAELESAIYDRFGSSSIKQYRDSVYHLISWIQTANHFELREVIEGRSMHTLSLENTPNMMILLPPVTTPPFSI